MKLHTMFSAVTLVGMVTKYTIEFKGGELDTITLSSPKWYFINNLQI
jgi:hypothetical protein